jgi:hypothetical protein
MCYSDQREEADSTMILVALGTIALMGSIFWWGVHSTKPRVVSLDMRRADHAESIEPDAFLAEPTRRAFDASTWAQV